MNLLLLLQTMSPNSKIGFAAGGAAVVIGVLAVVFQNHLVFLLLLLGLAILAVVSFLLVRVLLKAIAKRKAKPMEQSISGNLSAAPSQVSGAKKLADLESLRRSFQSGVGRFKAAGKDLYSLPWYVLVGQPGSGKTEAIRHSAIGFPPGLQDQLQGAGGTINMNWWFTNHAIILDTAGRLMFEEVAPGATGEWEEFLKLLRTSRPNCPINGMLLVIPAESLLTDTADVIAKNAGKIAQQLDMIQRTLGVRFPVFVLVTKSDYLTGFNQFFDDLTDPQLQHQMMGWSNPAPLDEPFKMEAVDAHLQEVRRRLIERRQRLLRDPVNTEDANSRRLDQVDALFALPDAVAKIAPRLRQYLETIFVAGEWSPKPLFLRGIYFTSSMSDGKTLDADLAQALGISVDALPASGVWRRDRAYFLKDLFLQKIFREKGLVTRASNAMKLQRQRKIAVIAAGFITVLILLALTWYGFHQFKAGVDNQREYWHNAAVIYQSPNRNYLNVIRRDRHSLGGLKFKYVGRTERVAGQPLAAFFARGLLLVGKPIRIPLIFRPVAIIGGTVNARRIEAYRTMFNHSIVAPLVAAAEAKLLAPPASAAPPPKAASAQTRALIELLNIARAHYAGLKKTSVIAESQRLNDLARFVLSPDDYHAWKIYQADSITQALKEFYQSGRQWPPANLSLASSRKFYRALRMGMLHTIAVWNQRAESGNASLARILALKNQLQAFDQTEKQLIKWSSDYQFSTSASAGTIAWNKVSHLMTALTAMYRKLHTSLAAVPRDQTLLEQFQASASRLITRRKEALALLTRSTQWIDALSLNKASAATSLSRALNGKLPPNGHADLVAARQYLQAVDASAQSPLAAAAEELKSIDLRDLHIMHLHREMTWRGRIYEAIEHVLTAPPAPTDILSTGPWLTQFQSKAQRIHQAAASLLTLVRKAYPDGARFNKLAVDASLTGLSVVQAHRLGSVIEVATRTHYASATELEHLVAQAAAKQHSPLPRRPTIALMSASGKPFNPAFDVQVGGGLIEAWSAMGRYIQPHSGSGTGTAAIFGAARLVPRYQSSNAAYQAYRQAYLQYWAGIVSDQLQVGSVPWRTFYSRVSTLQTGRLYANLIKLGLRVRAALESVPVDAARKAYISDILTSISTGLKQLNSPVQQRAWRKVLRRWMQISSDPLQARAQLLTDKPISLYRRYLIRSGPSSSFARLYLSSLTLAGFRALADNALARADAILTRLRQKPAFPLFIPADGGRPSTQFSAATIQQFAANIDALPVSVKRMSAQTPDSALNQLLRQMQGQVSYSVFGLTTPQIVTIRKILAALHGVSGKPLTCRIQVSAKDKLDAADNTAQVIWPFMTITDAGRVLGVVSFRSPAANSLGRIAIPGGQTQNLKLNFYESDPNSTPAPKPNHVLTFTGPWAPLQWLYLYHAVSSDGKHWRVVIQTRDQFKTVRKLVVSLSFSRPLPRIDAWPRAHAP